MIFLSLSPSSLLGICMRAICFETVQYYPLFCLGQTCYVFVACAASFPDLSPALFIVQNFLGKFYCTDFLGGETFYQNGAERLFVESDFFKKIMMSMIMSYDVIIIFVVEPFYSIILRTEIYLCRGLVFAITSSTFGNCEGSIGLAIRIESSGR